MRLARDRRRVECPFDSAARFDRINFPDVLDALPPRASAFGTPLNGIRERSRPTRRAEDGARDPVGGFVDDDPRTPSPYRGKLALEALDVEEARAAELADCTIEVLANSRPAPLTPIPIPAESDEIDSEDELESARNLAARVADELRCQRYFDDKTAAARLGRDPVLSSPAWIDARLRGHVSASEDDRSPTQNDQSTSPPGSISLSRAWSPTPSPGPPRRRPRGRGAARFAASPLGEPGESTSPRADGVDPDASFESVKNGLYELFCRSAEEDEAAARETRAVAETEMRTDMRTEMRAETVAETVAETALDRRRTNGTTSAETRSTHPTHPMSPDASMCGFADISPIVPYRDEDHDEDATDLTSRGYIFETDAPFEPFESGFESPRATTRIGPGSPPPGPPSRARKTRSRTADDFADAMDLSATATRLGLRMDDVADARAPNTPDVSEDDAETVVSEPRSAAKKREEEEEEEDEEEATAMALAVARAVSDATETAFDDENAPAPRCESCGRCVPSFPLGRASRSSNVATPIPGGGSDADVSDAEDDSARAEDDFDRHVLARTPRARVSSRRRRRRALRDASTSRDVSVGFWNATADERTARETPFGRKAAGLSSSASGFAALLAARTDARRPLAKETPRATFVAPRFPFALDDSTRFAGTGSRATRVNPSPDGASFGEPNAKTTSSFLDDSASRAWDGPLHKVLASFSPAGDGDGLAWEKGIGAGKRLDFDAREMEDPGRDAARDPYAFTAEIRRILDAVR